MAESLNREKNRDVGRTPNDVNGCEGKDDSTSTRRGHERTSNQSARFAPQEFSSARDFVEAIVPTAYLVDRCLAQPLYNALGGAARSSSDVLAVERQSHDSIDQLGVGEFCFRG